MDSSIVGSIMKRGASKLRPWVMLPPAFEGGEMVYRFYDLAEKRHVSVEKRGIGGEKEAEVPHDESVVVGSSHGWLALFNKRNRDLFLSNPLTRRHVKLPAIPAEQLVISKVIPTCDPDDGSIRNCLMIYGPRQQLEFCSPPSSWRNLSQRHSYGDCAYCSKYDVFFTSSCSEIEAWNVQRYKQEWMAEIGNQGGDTLYKPPGSCFIYKSLVVAEHHLLQLYDVARYVDKIDKKTIGFQVRKYNWEEKAWRNMDGSLDGLSFFLGRNHSFTTQDLDAHLKRDAIYFTDAYHHHHHDQYRDHDVGIFCYATKQFSSLYYPRDDHPITTTATATPPIFFTPSTLQASQPSPCWLHNA